MIEPLSDTELELKLSARLQDLRARRDWTLDDLANTSGISRATLSRIERGETSPTATQLGRLCTAYGMTMSRLLGGLDAASGEVIRAGAQGQWVDPATGFRRRMVSPPAEGLRMEMVEGRLPAGTVIVYDAPPLAGMEQHVWMLSGTLEFSHEETTHMLHAGDCLRLQLWGASRFHAPGPGPAHYLVCIGRPS